MLFEVKGWDLKDKKVKKGKEPKKVRKSKPEKKEKKSFSKDEQEQEHEKEEPSKRKRSMPAESEPEPVKETKKIKLDEAPPADVGAGIDQSKLTPLQRKMLAKLSGSRFRWINEQLYTTDSQQALEMMKKQPELFDEYHKGFASQVESWPENPVDLFTRELIYRGISKMVNSPGGLPGLKDQGHKVVVADMGCGEAELAIQVDKFMQSYRNQTEVKNALKKFKKKYGGGADIPLKNKKLAIDVHSFDLKKVNDKITVADIKNVPLDNNSCSIVIFCLSLMGTNFLDFIKEADRLLIPGGELWITEIKSRLSDPKGAEFIQAIESLGFKSRIVDDGNKMFTKFEFLKPFKSSSSKPIGEVRGAQMEGEWLLKPCIYKRR